MASITVQVGQCGNQVGLSYLDALHTHGAPSSHFRGVKRPRARAVLIDTEPKAIEAVVRAPRGWQYSNASIVRAGKGGGAANNWACGYSKHGPFFRDLVLDALRREAEACDHLASLVVTQSAAGGTGSGLGTYISQLLSDEYRKVTRVNCVVCPNRTGEVIVQNYNLCLTLARLQAEAHAVIALENEKVTEICKQALKIDRPSFAAMNGVIGVQLSSCLLPPMETSGRQRIQACRIPGIIGHMVPHKGYRFLQPTFMPQVPDASRQFTSDTWSALLKRLLQMHITGTSVDNKVNWSMNLSPEGDDARGKAPYNHAVSTLLRTWGNGAEGEEAAEIAKSLFGDRRLYSPWSPKPFLSLPSPRNFERFEKSASLLANGQSIVRVLEPPSQRAQEMYRARAYLHQYAAHGLEDADFEDSFITMEQIIHRYREISL